MTTDEQEGGNSTVGERSDAAAAPAARHGATPGPAGPGASLDEQIAQTMRASLAEPDPAKRSALNGQLKALYDARYPEPESTLKVTVPLTPEQATIAEAHAQDVSTLAQSIPGVDQAQVGVLFDYAVSESLQDVAQVTDEAQAMTVLRTRHGAGTDALVDDARRAVASLGDGVRDYLNSTGAGNSPGVIQALALWQRGQFKTSPQEARQRIKVEKDPLVRRLLFMLAARS